MGYNEGMNASGQEKGQPVLVWGALWGAAEAGFGHILHWLPIPGLAGLIMIPIGLFFMSRVYRETSRPGSIAGVAAVAAAVKMVDVLLPGRGMAMALRPALAILGEGLFVAVLFAARPLLVRRKA